MGVDIKKIKMVMNEKHKDLLDELDGNELT
jgi:hypothetical protein